MTCSRLLYLCAGSAIVLASWPLARAAGRQAERAHRRDFLAALGIVPTRAALASDSALGATVRAAVVARVPIGSDTAAVRAYVRRTGAGIRLTLENEMAASGLPTGAYLLRAKYPERARWYEFGVCDYTRALDFPLDSAFAVRDVSAGRWGTCI